MGDIYWATTGPFCVAATDGAFAPEVYQAYNDRQVYVRDYKIRCDYCDQKQSVSNNCCQYCGAPLPD